MKSLTESHTPPTKKIRYQTMVTDSAFGESGPDGIMAIPVKITCMENKKTSVAFTINVDGVSFTANSMQFELGKVDGKKGAHIEPPTLADPQVVPLETALGAAFKWNIWTMECLPVDQDLKYNGLLQERFNLTGIKPLPSRFFELNTNKASPAGPNWEVIDFSGSKLKKAPIGRMDIIIEVNDKPDAS